VSVPPPLTTLTKPESEQQNESVPRPFLFRVLEANQPMTPPARYDLSRVGEITFRRGNRGHKRSVGQPDRLELVVPDAWMSSSHARVSLRGANWLFEDLGSRNGSRVNGEAVKECVLADGDVIELGGTFYLFRRAIRAPAGMAADWEAGDHPAPALGLATLHPPFAHQLERLAAVALSQVSIVLQGETGVGKEVVARAVHAASRRKGEFVAVNCGAIPEALVESELFGHRRGAFSGALADRDGLVRNASGGTLLLDEIGEMRLGSQAALLRVLQEREVVPLGGGAPVRVDVRVIAATHRPLADLVDAEEFRADLLARLSGFVLELPPLRERREDLGLLVATFLQQQLGAAADKVTLAPNAVRALFAHAWPMNIRELHKAVEAALVLAKGGPIAREHLPALDAPLKAAEPELTEADRQRSEELDRLMSQHGGNVSEVARAMGRDRSLIRRWLRRYGLDPERYRVG
jgi:transcriptional regulator of acetoin/glycerol metabolism